MARLGLERTIVDQQVYARTLARFGEAKVLLPTIAQLRDPTTIPANLRARLADVDPDAPHPLNLFRVHWYNDDTRRGLANVPGHVELPPALTGVPARIVVALGDRFPMITAHKVLAAYGCLVPRVVTGQFDPTKHRAVWPSTGNYCRGGVAISRILGCRGVAVLPENMSQERFDWLDRWVVDPKSDVIRTPGSESNVKEIYDTCAALDRDPGNIIFNQFCEFGNYLIHRTCTGAALEDVFRAVTRGAQGARLAAYVSASGSGGTLAAGDHLKRALGARIVVAEALECPTLLENGFGEHNIQGIGDKHVPYIHNVMNTDVVAAVSDRSTDALFVLFNTEEGRRYLVERRGLDPRLVGQLSHLGLSGICNVLAAIKTAKLLDLEPDDVVLTVATDGAAMYGSQIAKTIAHLGGRFDAVTAGEIFGGALAGATTDHVLELRHQDRKRIFNLGYFTWVEQQGVSLDEFTARARPAFWDGLLDLVPAWDAMISEFNARSGAAASLAS